MVSSRPTASWVLSTGACLSSDSGSFRWYRQTYILGIVLAESTSRNAFMSCAVALMTSTTRRDYEWFISSVTTAVEAETGTRMNPQSLMCDHERAAISAFTFAFPDIDVRGCFFHTTQAVLRWVSTHGLKKAYDERGSLQRTVRCEHAPRFVIRTYRSSMALMRIPHEERHRVFDAVIDDVMRTDRDAFDKLESTGFFTYVSTSWLENKRTSVFGLSNRTNNAVESANARLGRGVRTATQCIYKYLDALWRFAAVDEDKLNRSEAGHTITKPLTALERQSRAAEQALEQQWRDTFTDAEAVAHVAALSRFIPG